MESQLKERVVGAIVLVVLAVIFIPVMISGPSSKDAQERESVPVPLPGTQLAKDAAATPAASEQSYSYDLSKPDTPLVQAPAREAPQQASPDAESTESTQPQAPSAETSTAAPSQEPAVVAGTSQPDDATAAPPKVEEEPPPAKPAPKSVSTAADRETAKPAAAAADDHWAVQAGSFSERSRAESVAAELEAKGFATFMMPVTVQGKAYYRVRIGPQATREAAENVAAKLRKHYRGPAQVVTHP